MNETLKKHFTKKRLIGICSVLAVTGTVVGYNNITQAPGVTRYVTAQAQKGMFIASLNGTGQVSAQNQIDVKPKVSGTVTAVLVKEGDQVKKDEPVLELDRTDGVRAVRDAAQSVHDAEISLSAAKLSLSKLRQPPTAAALLQAQDAVNQAERDLAKLTQGPNAYDLQQAQTQLQSAQQNAAMSSDGVTPLVVRNAYDSLTASLKTTAPSIGYTLLDADSVVGVDNQSGNASFADLLSVVDQSQKSQAIAAYGVAKTAYATAKADVDALPMQNGDTQSIDAAATAVQDALDKAGTMLAFVSNALNDTITSATFSQSSLDQLKSMIQSDRSNISSKQASTLSAVQAITQAKNSYASSGFSLQQAQIALNKLQQAADPKDVAAAEEKVSEAKQNLADLKAGATAIDIALSQNSVDSRASALTQAQNKLSDAQLALNDYSVRAPFDGVVAKITTQLADTASQGSAAATIVASARIADVTLNEVDAAKVAVGQKTTLTFDAIDGLSISGQVMEVGTLGTVSQGVVSYDVKIGFDTQDARVRPGMSVKAAIITNTKPDVIMVPNAAVKTSGGQSYVQIMDTASSSGPETGTPRNQPIQTGLVNDTDTEITSGLNGGENVVTQTILPSSASKTATKTATGIPGLGGAGGGTAFRGITGGGGGFRGN